jgi:hypothetical protein
MLHLSPFCPESISQGRDVLLPAGSDSGFASVVAKNGANRETEVGIIGRKGVTGLPVLLCDERSRNDTFIQLAGSGHLLPVDALRDGQYSLSL